MRFAPITYEEASKYKYSPDDDLLARLPLGHEGTDHLRRVLQVGDDADHGVAARR